MPGQGIILNFKIQIQILQDKSFCHWGSLKVVRDTVGNFVKEEPVY